MDSMPKNTSQRSYFSHCFLPRPPRRKPKTADPLLSYIVVAEKQGAVLPTILSSAFAAVKSGAGKGKGSACLRSKIGRDCCLHLRQALNYTSLGKKIVKSRKLKKYTCFSRSRINKLEECDRISSIECKNTTPALTLGSLSMNGIEVKKQKQLDVRDCRKGYFGSTTAMCLLLLISLLVLILWGKFYAILCTSTGFFVVSLMCGESTSKEP